MREYCTHPFKKKWKYHAQFQNGIRDRSIPDRPKFSNILLMTFSVIIIVSLWIITLWLWGGMTEKAWFRTQNKLYWILFSHIIELKTSLKMLLYSFHVNSKWYKYFKVKKSLFAVRAGVAKSPKIHCTRMKLVTQPAVLTTCQKSIDSF